MNKYLIFLILLFYKASSATSFIPKQVRQDSLGQQEYAQLGGLVFTNDSIRLSINGIPHLCAVTHDSTDLNKKSYVFRDRLHCNHTKFTEIDAIAIMDSIVDRNVFLTFPEVGDKSVITSLEIESIDYFNFVMPRTRLAFGFLTLIVIGAALTGLYLFVS